jgi:CRISP-associated protein Cas1
MSFHIVSIDSPQCSLSCKDGQLTCKTPEGEKKLPIEDVASIIITSFSANIHSHLFLEAAKHGVALIICEDFKPASLVLPANRSTDTLLSRALLKLDQKTITKLWQQTVDAKCRNQYSLAAHLCPDDRALSLLRETASGRKPHKEAICAKLFWQVFGRFTTALCGQQQTGIFLRDRTSGGLNALLNYGYAVLLSTVLQKLFGLGLDPTFGISHVIQWVQQHNGLAPVPEDDPFSKAEWTVTAPFRKWVTGFPLDRVEYLDLTLDVRGCIEGVVRGFRRAVLQNDARYYKPWTPRNSKWAG